MKIVLVSVGTRGDLQPFVALGHALQQSGHEVLIISARNEEQFVRDHGLNFYGLAVDIQELMGREEVKKMAKGNNPLKFFVSHLKGSKKLKQLMIESQSEIWEASKDAAMIIFHPGMPIGYFMAKELNKVSILLNPFPVIPTRDYPAILFYRGPRLGKYYNAFTHYIFQKLFWTLSKPAIKAFWTKQIGPKINLSKPAIEQQVSSGMPVINAYSNFLFCESKDWSKNIHTVGGLQIESDVQYNPPAKLVDFIRGGTQPIYFGFGSMKDLESFRSTFSIIKEAVAATGQRAVVGLGWNKLDQGEHLPENIFLIDNVPFSWLFPQMSLVIHHGGAGTTDLGLRAGKPTIIIPHFADQPAWGLGSLN